MEVEMSTTSELNLTGVISPVCLLKCKSSLNVMKPGERLEVILGDPEVADDLLRIVERSSDRIITRKKEGDCYRVCIEKAKP